MWLLRRGIVSVLLVELVVEEDADSVKYRAAFRLRGVSRVMSWIVERY